MGSGCVVSYCTDATRIRCVNAAGKELFGEVWLLELSELVSMLITRQNQATQVLVGTRVAFSMKHIESISFDEHEK